MARDTAGACTLQMVVLLLLLLVRPEDGDGRRLAADLNLRSGRAPTVGSMLSRSSVVVESCLQNLRRSKALLESTDLPCSVLRLGCEVKQVWGAGGAAVMTDSAALTAPSLPGGGAGLTVTSSDSLSLVSLSSLSTQGSRLPRLTDFTTD